MLNAVIEVAIGLTVVYALLSLVCTKVTEWIAGTLSLRPKKLYTGIQHLVGTTYTRRVYAHPLIRSLYRDDSDARRPTRLPSYIPAEKFVVALLDAAVPAAITTPPPIPPEPTARIDAERGAAPSPPPAAGGVAPSPVVAAVTGELAALPSPLQGSLQALWRAADHDVTAFRAGVQDWFNQTMDRVSGWYKRQAHLIIVVLGFTIAAGLNVDSIRITERLWNDNVVRTVAVEQVKKLPPPPASGGGSPTTIGPLGDQVQRSQSDLRKVPGLQLPMGWGRGQHPTTVVGFLVATVGWALTAVALSFGAPFWFDLVGKVVSLRSAGTKEPTPAQAAAPARR